MHHYQKGVYVGNSIIEAHIQEISLPDIWVHRNTFSNIPVTNCAIIKDTKKYYLHIYEIVLFQGYAWLVEENTYHIPGANFTIFYRIYVR